MTKTVTFEVCNCGAMHKHGYFHVNGIPVPKPIYSTPNGQRVLATIATDNYLSDDDVASAKAQLEAADLAAEILEHEKQMAAAAPEMIKLLAALERLGGRVIVLQ